jgi:hypothetical protein
MRQDIERCRYDSAGLIATRQECPAQLKPQNQDGSLAESRLRGFSRPPGARRPIGGHGVVLTLRAYVLDSIGPMASECSEPRLGHQACILHLLEAVIVRRRRTEMPIGRPDPQEWRAHARRSARSQGGSGMAVRGARFGQDGEPALDLHQVHGRHGQPVWTMSREPERARPSPRHTQTGWRTLLRRTDQCQRPLRNLLFDDLTVAATPPGRASATMDTTVRCCPTFLGRVCGPPRSRQNTCASLPRAINTEEGMPWPWCMWNSDR